MKKDIVSAAGFYATGGRITPCSIQLVHDRLVVRRSSGALIKRSSASLTRQLLHIVTTLKNDKERAGRTFFTSDGSCGMAILRDANDNTNYGSLSFDDQPHAIMVSINDWAMLNYALAKNIGQADFERQGAYFYGFDAENQLIVSPVPGAIERRGFRTKIIFGGDIP